ncbi:MAG: DUF126 domain-containing protein [Pseudomonadota bacterium]
MTARSIDIEAVLHPGFAKAPALKLSEALSFWGGFDPRDGRILDPAHPQRGEIVTNHVLAMPGSRGSAGTPAGIAEAMRRGVGPAAIVLLRPDVNIAIGAQVASRLYGSELPVVLVTKETFAGLDTGTTVLIDTATVVSRSPHRRATS